MGRFAFISRLAVLFLALALPGCASLRYYAQAIGGQLDLLHRSKPIDEVVHAPETRPALGAKLETVLRIREFASRELGLPDNRSYRNYADLERPFVVWNVFAAPELSLKPREWCFPVVGCVEYRGYFSKADAEQFAESVRRQGYDVFVYGVPAYSTLGWFDDPVLNTFIHYPDSEVARLIFHELAHQVTYIRDDSTFNESFAVAVEQEGVRRWLKASGTEAQQAAFETAQRRKREFTALVMKYRERLEALYGEAIGDDEKRRGKARILDEMQDDYRRLRDSWGGFKGYDRWFAQRLNNAHFGSVAAYTQLVPAFEALLARENHDLPRFYQAVKKLGRLPKAERVARLEELERRAVGTADEKVGLTRAASQAP